MGAVVRLPISASDSEIGSGEDGKFDMRFALRLDVPLVNRKSPVLFVHGFGASIGHWRKNLNAFGDRDTYALDLIGFGNSEKIEQEPSKSTSGWSKSLAFGKRLAGQHQSS